MLSGQLINLRSLETSDLTYLYKWENDPANWEVSGTLTPYAKEVLQDFIANSDKDIYTTKQIRFIIETKNEEPIGTIDLFDFEPTHKRAGVGILIGNYQFRNKGMASEALQLLEIYCKKVLKLHQLFCQIEEENTPSITLFTKLGYVKKKKKKEWLLNFKNQFCDIGFYQKKINE